MNILRSLREYSRDSDDKAHRPGAGRGTWTALRDNIKSSLQRRVTDLSIASEHSVKSTVYYELADTSLSYHHELPTQPPSLKSSGSLISGLTEENLLSLPEPSPSAVLREASAWEDGALSFPGTVESFKQDNEKDLPPLPSPVQSVVSDDQYTNIRTLSNNYDGTRGGGEHKLPNSSNSNLHLSDRAANHEGNEKSSTQVNLVRASSQKISQIASQINDIAWRENPNEGLRSPSAADEPDATPSPTGIRDLANRLSTSARTLSDLLFVQNGYQTKPPHLDSSHTAPHRSKNLDYDVDAHMDFAQVSSLSDDIQAQRWTHAPLQHHNERERAILGRDRGAEAPIPSLISALHGKSVDEFWLANPQLWKKNFAEFKLFKPHVEQKIHEEEQMLRDEYELILAMNRDGASVDRLCQAWNKIHPLHEDPTRDQMHFIRTYLGLVPHKVLPRSTCNPHGDGIWLALVKWMSTHPTVNSNSHFSPQTIRAIWAASDQFFREYHFTVGAETTTKIKLGQILDKCYETYLISPAGTQTHHAMHLVDLMDALDRANISAKRAVRRPQKEHTLDELRDMSVAQYHRSFSHSTLKPDEGIQLKRSNLAFRRTDFSLPLLRRFGDLKIEWTTYLDEHLQLLVGSNVLKVYWFGATFFHHSEGWLATGKFIPAYFQDLRPDEDLLKLHLDIRDALQITYMILFAPSVNNSSDRLRSYRTMPLPFFVETFYHAFDPSFPTHKDLHTMGDLIDNVDILPTDTEGETTSHLNWEYPLPTSIGFAQLGPFEERMRILETYMKSKHPNTLIDLWRDRRDTLSWWTLWAVIFIGGAGLLLSILSLGVTALQTYASLKQLEQSGP